MSPSVSVPKGAELESFSGDLAEGHRPHSTRILPRVSVRRRITLYVIVSGILILLYASLKNSTWQGSTELHTLMEAGGTLLAFFVGLVALVRFHAQKDNMFLFIGTGFLGTALLDGYHTIVTSSWFDQLLPSPLSSLIPWSWSASRFFLAVLMYVSWRVWRREQRLGASGKIGEGSVYLVVAGLTVSTFAFFALVPLPRAYYPELLLLVRPEELLAGTFLLAALAGYFQKGDWKHDPFDHFMVLSLIIGFAAQALFMPFSSRLFDSMFDAAYLLKSASYACVIFGLLSNVHHVFRKVEHSARSVSQTNEKLRIEIVERKKAQSALEEGRNELERRVKDRTSELAEAERRYRDLFNNAPDLMAVTDLADGRILQCNQTMVRELGYDEDDLIGRSVWDLYAKKYAEDARRTSLSVAETGKILESERAFVRRDGTQLEVLLHATQVRDEEGKVVASHSTWRDITQMKRLERERNQAQKLESIGQLAAGIAHEINTPTQYVGDNTNFLKDAFADLEPVLASYEKLLALSAQKADLNETVTEVEAARKEADLEYLREEIPQAIEQSLEGISRVASIVRAMKEFAHPGGNDKVAIDLGKAVESTLTVSRNEWKYVADVQTDFDSNLPSVPCLPGDLNQALLNLIVNASHAIGDKNGNSGQKGLINISTRRVNGWAEIRVQDNGPGIPQEIQDRIFDPFFTTKEVGKGSGQGLAICHSVIVDKHGGKILVESTPGQGTTFVLQLPLDHEEQE